MGSEKFEFGGSEGKVDKGMKRRRTTDLIATQSRDSSENRLKLLDKHLDDIENSETDQKMSHNS